MRKRHRAGGRLIRTTAMGAVSLCIAATAGAQDEVSVLDELVVVGSQAPARISELPGTVYVVDAEQISEQIRAGTTLKEALGKLIPSLDVAPQGRTNFGQNLRGRSALVMIDGVSLNSSRGLSRQFDSIDPFNIARVEVLSGANALYGGGATGGIINIITKRGAPGEARFESQIGATSGFNASDDYEARAAQSISGGNDLVQGRLGLAYQQNGAFFGGDGDQILPDITQTDLQYNRSIDVLGSLDFSLPAGQTLALNAQYYDSRYEGNTGLYLGENLGAVTGAAPDSFGIRSGFYSDRVPATRRHSISGTYYNPQLLGQEFYLQAYTRSEEAAFHPFPQIADLNRDGRPEPFYAASEQHTDLHGGKALLVADLDPVRLQYGVEIKRDQFDANQMLFDFPLVAQSGGLILEERAQVGRYPSYDVDSYSAFLQGEWQASERLRLSAGVRQQHSKVEVEDFVAAEQQVAVSSGFANSAEATPGGSNDYDTTLFNVGAVFDVNARNQIRVHFSQGFELPDPASYYGRGSYDLAGGDYRLVDSINVEDSPLKAIKTDQVELGWRYAGDRLAAQAALYYAWSDEALERDMLLIDVVDQKTRDYGVEAEASYRLNRSWQLGGSGHWVRSEEKIDGDWDKREATAASLSKATAFVGWQHAGTRARLQYTQAFDLDDDQGNEIDGFHTFDLLTSQQLPVGELAFGIRNLLDEDYVSIWSQRAQIFYSPALGPQELFEFKGRGRTYNLTYTVRY